MSHVLAFGHHCETPVSRTSPTDQHMLVAMPAPKGGVCTERWLGWCFSRSDTLFLCHRLLKFNLGILLGPQSKKFFAVAKFELELSLSSVGQPSPLSRAGHGRQATVPHCFENGNLRWPCAFMCIVHAMGTTTAILQDMWSTALFVNLCSKIKDLSLFYK